MHLVSETNLLLPFYFDNTHKFHGPENIKAASESKIVTVPLEIIPLVNINSIPLVGYNLYSNIVTVHISCTKCDHISIINTTHGQLAFYI